MQQNGYVDGDEGPINIFLTSKGPVTLDNTRPTLALQLGVKVITARIRTMQEPLPPTFPSRRLDFFNGKAKELGLPPPKTWGDLLRIRIQDNDLPIEGTTTPPTLTGG